jgi:hypothetical protein
MIRTCVRGCGSARCFGTFGGKQQARTSLLRQFDEQQLFVFTLFHAVESVILIQQHRRSGIASVWSSFRRIRWYVLKHLRVKEGIRDKRNLEEERNCDPHDQFPAQLLLLVNRWRRDNAYRRRSQRTDRNRRLEIESQWKDQIVQHRRWSSRKLTQPEIIMISSISLRW